MSELKELVRDSFAVALIGLACLFMGLVGAVSWHSHCRPSVPNINSWTKPESAELMFQQYNQDVADIGKDAVVPKTYAVAMTVVGFAGCVLAFGVVIYRNQE